MTWAPLAAHTTDMVCDALVQRGMERDRAEAAIQAVPVDFVLDRLPGIGQSAPTDKAPQVGNWVMARGVVTFDRPLIVGILNITPDSFSDGGRYLHPTAAMRHAEEMIEAGADLLDIGAQSTRPGRPEAVPAAEEWRRLKPVVGQLARQYPDYPITIDTVRAETAERALGAGAWAVNDVSGLRLDPRIADVCAEHGAGVILMHSRGSLPELATYDHATYEDVTAETARELRQAMELACERGVPRNSIVLDPGFGFSKMPEQNYELLGGLPALSSTGLPLMVGPSRKRFLDLTADDEAVNRDSMTAAVCLVAYALGAMLFRVHAVHLVRDILTIYHAST